MLSATSGRKAPPHIRSWENQWPWQGTWSSQKRRPDGLSSVTWRTISSVTVTRSGAQEPSVWTGSGCRVSRECWLRPVTDEGEAGMGSTVVWGTEQHFLQLPCLPKEDVFFFFKTYSFIYFFASQAVCRAMHVPVSLVCKGPCDIYPSELTKGDPLPSFLLQGSHIIVPHGPRVAISPVSYINTTLTRG